MFVCTLLSVALFPHLPASAAEDGSLATILDETVREEMERQEIPGVAYALVSGDRVVHRGCFGTRKLGEEGIDWQVDRETVFQIGSATKAFTATLTATLVEEDAIGWEDRVTDHLPGFRLKDSFAQEDFRIFDLMAQHSGLPGYALDMMPALGYEGDDAVKALRYVEPASPFRSEYAYQNILFLYVADLIEKTTGESWNKNIEARIANPLELDSVGATWEAFVDTGDNMAWLHRMTLDGTEMLPLDWPWQDWVYRVSPAGAIHLDIDDFARWLRVQINRGSVDGTRILPAEQMDYLTAPKTLISVGGGGSYAYCLGWLREESPNGVDIVWHNGATLGAHSIIGFLPDHGVGIAVLTNQSGNLLPELMLQTLGAHLAGKGTEIPAGIAAPLRATNRTASKGALPAQEIDTYSGTYDSPIYGTLKVTGEGEDLTARFETPRPLETALTPLSEDVFAGEWDFLPDPAIRLSFQGGEGGKPAAVTVDVLDDGQGMGRFDREDSDGGGGCAAGGTLPAAVLLLLPLALTTFRNH
ncbi:MAG: serine hydrolase [Synergistales bacterium]|nr:serine hydrolase [Synergistales bacterium]